MPTGCVGSLTFMQKHVVGAILTDDEIRVGIVTSNPVDMMDLNALWQGTP